MVIQINFRSLTARNTRLSASPTQKQSAPVCAQCKNRDGLEMGHIGAGKIIQLLFRSVQPSVYPVLELVAERIGQPVNSAQPEQLLPEPFDQGTDKKNTGNAQDEIGNDEEGIVQHSGF